MTASNTSGSGDSHGHALSGDFDFDQVRDRKGTDSLKWERYGDRDVLPMWVADMDFAVAPVIQAALQERLAHPLYGYSVPSAGLTEAIQQHLLDEYGWPVEAEWLVYLPGVVSGMSACCRAFCASGERIVVNPPIYHHFFDSHDASRHVLDSVPLLREGQRWTYDMKAMREAFAKRPSLAMLCTPHNPVGTVFTPDELREVAELCNEFDTVLVSDEIHCDLVLNSKVRHTPTACACPEQADRIVTLMSASKTWNLAGLNTSFAIISNAELRERFSASCQSVMPMVPPLALVASEVAYREGGPWRLALLDYLRGNLQRLHEVIDPMPELELEPLDATYLAWINGTALGVPSVAEHLEAHGLGLSAGEQFGQPGYVRLNFACPRATLDEGLKRLVQAVEAARSHPAP